MPIDLPIPIAIHIAAENRGDAETLAARAGAWRDYSGLNEDPADEQPPSDFAGRNFGSAVTKALTVTHSHARADRRKGERHLRHRAGAVGRTDVRGQVVAGSGHWLIDEAPDKMIPALIEFIN